MASDQITGFQDHVWLKDVSKKLDQKMRFILRKAQDVNYIPYSMAQCVCLKRKAIMNACKAQAEEIIFQEIIFA